MTILQQRAGADKPIASNTDNSISPDALRAGSLPQSAEEKFEALTTEFIGARAAAHSYHEVMEGMRDTEQNAKGDLANNENAGYEPGIAAAQREVKRAVDARKVAGEKQVAAVSLMHTLKDIYRPVETAVRRAGQRGFEAVEVPAVKVPAGETPASLADAVKAAKKERDATMLAPEPFDSAAARLMAEVDTVAKPARGLLSIYVTVGARDKETARTVASVVWPMTNVAPAIGEKDDRVIDGAALCAFVAGDAIKAKVLADLKAAYKNVTVTYSPAERVEALKAVDATIGKLERQLAAAIWAEYFADGNGAALVNLAGLNPEITLGIETRKSS